MNHYSHTIMLSGDLDIATRPTLEHQLEALARIPILVLNLSEVTYLDSSTLRVLVTLWNRRKYTPGSLLLVPPTRAHVRKIFELAGLDQVLPFVQADSNQVFAGVRDLSGAEQQAEVATSA